VSGAPTTLGVVTVYCDGGRKHNKNKEYYCYGSYRIADGGIVTQDFLTATTNNQAEYYALLAALRAAKAAGHRCVEVVSDSELMIGHVWGLPWDASKRKCYACNNKSLRALRDEVWATIAVDFNDVVFRHISGDDMKEILGH
jgi:ribonuclease HI